MCCGALHGAGECVVSYLYRAGGAGLGDADERVAYVSGGQVAERSSNQATDSAIAILRTGADNSNSWRRLPEVPGVRLGQVETVSPKVQAADLHYAVDLR